MWRRRSRRKRRTFEVEENVGAEERTTKRKGEMEVEKPVSHKVLKREQIYNNKYKLE